MRDASSRSRPVVLIFGPTLTAVSGVSTHVRLLQGSSLDKYYNFVHFEVGSEGRNETAFHKLFRLVVSPWVLIFQVTRLRPAIVHINTSFNPKAVWRDLVYLAVVKILGRKVVYQIHGGHLPKEFCQHNRLIEIIIRKMLATPDVVVLLSEAEYRPYLEFSPIRRLEVIPNAIDLAEFDDTIPKTYNAELIRLVYIGRLVEEKGIQDTIKALAMLRDDYGYENLRFIIAGTGSYEENLKRLVHKLKLEDKVEFLGPIFGHEKRRFWGSADIFVFPTFHQEGLPYALLEALASATPVVATAMGAMAEVVKDGIQGIFVPPKNPEHLASTLNGLLADRAALRRMSREALQRAVQAYGIQQLSAGFERIYGALLSDARKND